MTDEKQRQTLAAGIRWAINQMPETTRNAKAARLCVAVTTIDKWKSGSSLPNEANLARLARRSGVEQDDIRNGGHMTTENTDE